MAVTRRVCAAARCCGEPLRSRPREPRHERSRTAAPKRALRPAWRDRPQAEGAPMSAAAAIRRYPTPLPVPLSKAVRAGDFLFVSGVLATDAQANIVEGDV